MAVVNSQILGVSVRTHAHAQNLGTFHSYSR